jgi:hypothetical protein
MDDPTRLETQGTSQKSNGFRLAASVLIVLLIIGAVGAYTWFFLYNRCEEAAVKEASAILISQLNFYDRVYQVATNASPTSLVRPVDTLQQILRDTQQVDVPTCMQTAKNELINYMGTVIRAFQAYAAGEANATVIDLIDQSNAHYGKFSMELDTVNKCAPFCFP